MPGRPAPVNASIPLAIVGPTAAGKSALAMAVATLDPRVELISADSMQVYRGMDIGTAKPSPEEQLLVPHHLIDVMDPDQDYTVSRFAQDVDEVATAINERGGIAVLVGGTGLYVRSVVDDFEIPGNYPQVKQELEQIPDTAALYERLVDLDPLAATRMEPTNRRRVLRALEVTLGSGRKFSDWGPGLDRYPPIPTRQLACDRARPSLDLRISARYDHQMNHGFLEEVRSLAQRPAGLSRTARQALGYRELLTHLEDGVALQDALEEANRRTRRFARRQQRWFRRDPRIEWVDLDQVELDRVAAEAAQSLDGQANSGKVG